MRFSPPTFNAGSQAHMYQVTATAARVRPPVGCSASNETECSVSNEGYCLTTGIVCDGINNCGVPNWY